MDKVETFCKIQNNGFTTIIVGKENKIVIWSNDIVKRMNEQLKEIDRRVKIPLINFSRAQVGKVIASLKDANKNISVIIYKNHWCLLIEKKK